MKCILPVSLILLLAADFTAFAEEPTAQPTSDGAPRISLRPLTRLPRALQSETSGGAGKTPYAVDFTLFADSFTGNTARLSFTFPTNPITVAFTVSPVGSTNGTCKPSTLTTNFPSSGSCNAATTYTAGEAEHLEFTVNANPTRANLDTQTRQGYLQERLHAAGPFPIDLSVTTVDSYYGWPSPTAVYVSINPSAPSAGTLSRTSGMSEWDYYYYECVFTTTFTPSDSYVSMPGNKHVRIIFSTGYDSYMYSLDLNQAGPAMLINNWRTVSDSFRASEDNPQQYHRIASLNPTHVYDFSIAEADGVGGSCDGNGDFAMYDSNGTLLWSINGDARRGYAASTLDTAYENWSPPAGGVYYLKVTEHNGGDLVYTLAARDLQQSSLTITGPAGSPVWTAGSTGVVTWTYTGSPGKPTIELYRGESLVRTIATNVNLTGTYSWPLPNDGSLLDGSDYRIKISSPLNPPWYDFSDYFSISAGTDTDHDGLPDAWERTNFGDLSHDGTVDSDGDGLKDWEEYVAGTSPMNTNQTLKITHFVPAAGSNAVVGWGTRTGRTYSVTTAATIGTNWLDVWEGEGNGAMLYYTNPAGSRGAFFRIGVRQP